MLEQCGFDGGEEEEETGSRGHPGEAGWVVLPSWLSVVAVKVGWCCQPRWVVLPCALGATALCAGCSCHLCEGHLPYPSRAPAIWKDSGRSVVAHGSHDPPNLAQVKP